ncbi:cupin domain-containing protein [Novosphingobium beihaiensis]|uniref:Cupin domain-containing protein n=1 Tax=Novosphingobium beihaiensis TaxID=2930389 RepID=A0ABT0BVX9_9SPHN|nr:cupin domain-containing protein [Novosphingobium beihaiensis]MCJ2189208.1 cupin domain-containing protein [Novosphingobium beihaiensis]
MNDVFVHGMAGGLPLPKTGTAMLRAGGEWQESASPGFLVMPLLNDAETGLRTFLMRFEPGAYATTHSHEEVEQIYVLEGEMYDDDTIYGAGDFFVRAPGAPHLAGSREGATVLVSYFPAERAA